VSLKTANLTCQKGENPPQTVLNRFPKAIKMTSEWLMGMQWFIQMVPVRIIKFSYLFSLRAPFELLTCL